MQLRSLYTLPNFQFVIPEPALRGKFDIVRADSQGESIQNALRLEVQSQGESKIVTLLGGKGIVNDPKNINLAGLDFFLQFGSKALELPFSIKLNDFIANILGLFTASEINEVKKIHWKHHKKSKGRCYPRFL